MISFLEEHPSSLTLPFVMTTCPLPSSGPNPNPNPPPNPNPNPNRSKGFLESTEDVPFRLTPNLMQVMSPFLMDGVLMTTMGAVAQVG